MSNQARQNHRKPEPDAGVAGMPKQRPCLMCGSAFDSAWSGERICPTCKNKAIWRTGIQLSSRPPGIGR